MVVLHDGLLHGAVLTLGIFGNRLGFRQQLCSPIQIGSGDFFIKENDFLILGVAVNDTLNTLCSDGIGIVHHLDQDKLAIAAIGLVHVQNRMSGSTGTGEGIEDNGIGISGNLQNTLKQSGRFGCFKRSSTIKDCL